MNEWHEAEQRVERAQRLCETQRWAEALGELEAAIAINPENAGWHAQRGCLLEELGRTEDAVAAFERSLELESDDPEVTMALSIALSSLGRKARALALLESLAARHADFEPAYCQRIKILAEVGAHELAEQVFYLAQQVNEDCPDCFFHMGESLCAREQHERALYCWKKVIELEPHYFGVHRKIADLHRNVGRIDDAKEHFLSELRLDPGNTDLLCELGEMALEAQDVQGASARFNYVLELDPTIAQAELALARIRRTTGDHAQAIEHFCSAIELEDELKKDPVICVELADSYFQTNQLTDARAELERTLELHPNLPSALKLLGRCLLALERPGDAADCFRRRLAHESDDSESKYLLGVSLLRHGKHEAGLGHFLELLAKHPTSAPCLFHVASAYVDLNRFGEARSIVRKASQLHPKHPEFKEIGRRCGFARQFAGWLRGLTSKS